RPVPSTRSIRTPSFFARARTGGVDRGRSPVVVRVGAPDVAPSPPGPCVSWSSTAVEVTRRETWVSPAARRGRRAGRPTRSGRAPYPTRFGSGPSSDAGSAARGAGGAGVSSGTAGPAPDAGAAPFGGGAAAPSSTSNVTSGSPTLTVWPSSACSDATTPAYGEGRSTSALAVSTSAITWLSSTR